MEAWTVYNKKTLTEDKAESLYLMLMMARKLNFVKNLGISIVYRDVDEVIVSVYR